MSLAFHGRERNIPLDVALLRSLNILVVLVHGAAEQIKALSEKQSIEASHLEATGVTDATTLQLAIDVANRLTHEILKRLSASAPRGPSIPRRASTRPATVS